MAWLSITFELDPGQAEALSEALLEAGAASVSLEPAAANAVTVEPGAHIRLIALAAATADPAALVGAAVASAAIAAPAFTVAQLEDEDWVRRSQAQFGPIRIAERLWIVPSWHTPPDPAALVVRLDPGLAFGTGSHVSTRLMLQYLERNLRAGQRVLEGVEGAGELTAA